MLCHKHVYGAVGIRSSEAAQLHFKILKIVDDRSIFIVLSWLKFMNSLPPAK